MNLQPRTFSLTRADLAAYAEASGDHNPIHADDEVARSVGLPGVIAHGMLTLALVGRAVTEWYPDHEVVSLGAKFVAPVVVPPDGEAVLEVFGEEKGTDDDGLVAVALTALAGGQKVLGAPRAVIRPRG